MRDYRKIRAWQEADDLTVAIYETTKQFPKEEIYGITSQLRRAAYSVPSNIAEGSERGTQPDFARFLRYSKGSSGELRTQAYVAEKLGILKSADARAIIDETRQLSAMIEGLIRSLK